ncbi:MAG: cytidylyltransferase [Gammaproteobacteria bacterium]|nr:cytidylyltransferase [Gammaproteobacteria bacterium]|tara:strand:- start:2091 stop:2810 length:720 start_codon:yes stop_codon:yes gene_type:complete
MISNKNVLAITLARGGSKSIYKKNIALLKNKPLISYTINAALDSKYIDEYIISTDDKEIADVAENLGATIPFLRPENLSSDTASSADALIHAVNAYEEITKKKYDYIIELMCTNPFKSGEMIDDIISKLDRNEKADAVITVERLLDHHPARIKKIENGYIRDFCVEEELESRRQDLKPEAYIRNGNIYALRRDLLMIQKARYGTNFCIPYYKEDIPSANIDEPSDFYKAESLLNDWDQK